MVATAQRVPSRPSRRFGGARGQTTHKGVDLYGPMGEPVKAPAAGVVQHAHTTYFPGFGGYGRVVVIALDGGGELLSGHLEDIHVRQGQRVARGDVFGTVGDTEFTEANPTKRFESSLPHTHVEFLADGHYPVRKAVTRQNPNRLAFYVEKKKGRVMPPPPKTEFFASPQDAQDRADALLDRWNALINQALGPGARRRGDVPKNLQEQIINDRARYRSFITRPTFGMGGVLWPREWEDLQVVESDYKTLQRWYDKYQLRAKQVVDVLPQGEPLLPEAEHEDLPRKTTPTENLELASKAARNLAIGVAIAAAAGGLAAILWSRAKS